MTKIFFFIKDGCNVSSFSKANEGFIVQATGLPNIMPFKQRKHPIHGRISSMRPSFALLANSGSQRLARPIIHASAFPLAMISSATQGSTIRPTVATGMETCFLISAAKTT